MKDFKVPPPQLYQCLLLVNYFQHLCKHNFYWSIFSDDDDEEGEEDFEVPPPQASPPLTPGHRHTTVRREAERVDLQKNFSKLDLSK